MEIYGAAGLASAQAGLNLDDEINQGDEIRLSSTRRIPMGAGGGTLLQDYGSLATLTLTSGTLAGNKKVWEETDLRS